MENYEIVYDNICRLGGARLDRIAKECRLSRSTVSRAIRELDIDYMIRVENKVWHPTSVMPKTLGQPAKPGQLGHHRSGLRCGTEKPWGSGVVDQDADLPMVMKHIVDDLVMARTEHNRLEGIRTIRAKISRKRRRMTLLDPEVTRELRVLARLLWVARTDNTWDAN